jgi:hypothetical protein
MFHEETWVFDVEGFGPFNREASPQYFADLDALCERVAGPAGDSLALAFLAYCSNVGITDPVGSDDAESSFEDAYRGEFDSELDYAYEDVESSGYLNTADDFLANYFDYEAYARDLFMSDLFSIPCPYGGVWVFSNH